MLAYIICFAITLSVAYLYERNLLRRIPRKWFQTISAALVIILPALLAGVRHYSIGTDVLVYGKPVFERAVSSGSLQDLIIRYSDIEPGFVFLAFIVSRFTSNLQVFLFIISFLIGSLVYLSLFRKRETCSIFMGESIYLLLVYNLSLNIMRQAIAIAFVVLGITYLMEKKNFVFFLIVLIACMFHKSAIVSALYYALFRILRRYDYSGSMKKLNKKERSKYWFRLVMVSMFAVIGAALFQYLLTILEKFGLLSERYSSYLYSKSMGTIRWQVILLYILPYYALFERNNLSDDRYFYLSVGIVDVASYTLRRIVFYFVRLSYYFMACRLLSLTHYRINFGKIIKTGKLNRNEAIALFVLVVSIAYWWLTIIRLNDNQTYPYRMFN